MKRYLKFKQHIKNIKRGPGRPIKFKAWTSVIIGIIVIGVIASIGYKTQKAYASEVKAATFEIKVLTKEQQMTKLLAENEALRHKLEESSKIKVDDRTKDLVKFYIHKYFGDTQTLETQAIKVFTCESGLSPNAIHVNKEGLGYDAGVPQINSKFHKDRFEKMSGMAFDLGSHDIDQSIKYARALYDSWGGSWNPWVCSALVGVK